jgi:transcriptional regulator with XRE-family HTH domain
MEKLGSTIKEARLHADMTRKELAEKLNVTTRHLMAIENGKQKPSYDLLKNLIRSLFISADSIFFPEAEHGDEELKRAIAVLRTCNDKELGLIIYMIHALHAIY